MSADGDTDQAAIETGLASPVARRFVEALRAIEDRGDLDGMIALGGETTRWWGTGPDEAQSGPDGAQRFWSGYRRAFAEIESEFTDVTETSSRIVLEWTSRGRHHSGAPVRYTGATVLALGGSPDEPELAAVRLYYDTAATLVQAPEPGNPHAGDGEPPMLDRETAASGRNSGLTDRG
ncbi:nuclear transport factor 2 family protein [Actinomycetospora sp.]|jgi:hypothetical protein|uniref:nuclear transport factor 2 family protein n=1 Tax=Actinomycetospora sp. TaxID=1872135 RepID=UPI002F3ECBF6